MKEKPPFEEHKERQRWATEIAQKYRVELSEGAEFFIVPIYDENGKEIRREFIPAREKIPLADEEGNATRDVINVEDAIEAVRRFPGKSLRAAKQKLGEERN